MPTFEQELTTLINKHSLENQSNTPDYILAQYLQSCLNAYTNAVKTRDTWYGITKVDPQPPQPTTTQTTP
jgi:hypothetical protein